MLGSSKRFEVLSIVYNSDGFAIAKGYWDGDKSKLRYGCRWHHDDKNNVGFPQSYGKHQWLLLPDCEIGLNINFK